MLTSLSVCLLLIPHTIMADNLVCFLFQHLTVFFPISCPVLYDDVLDGAHGFTELIPPEYSWKEGGFTNIFAFLWESCSKILLKSFQLHLFLFYFYTLCSIFPLAKKKISQQTPKYEDINLLDCQHVRLISTFQSTLPLGTAFLGHRKYCRLRDARWRYQSCSCT